MHKDLNLALGEIRLSLGEKKNNGVADLDYPQDCDQRELLKAAEKDGEVRHGGNHDSVYDPETGQMVTQLPRHNPKSGTCRAIIKALKKAFMKKKTQVEGKKPFSPKCPCGHVRRVHENGAGVCGVTVCKCRRYSGPDPKKQPSGSSFVLKVD